MIGYYDESDFDDGDVWSAEDLSTWGGCGEIQLDVHGGKGKQKVTAGDEPLEEEVTECALDVDCESGVCSGKKMMAVVKDFTGGDGQSPKEILDEAKMKTQCNSEECVLLKVSEAMPAAEALVKETIAENLKVTGPANSLVWLDNNNIDSVLEQLCRKHKTLKHMDFHMINFDDHKKPLATLNMWEDVISRGYKMFCVVINTDKYGNSGIHWFCIFCDFRTAGTPAQPYTIEYFNSSGNHAPTAIANWMYKTKYNIECASHESSPEGGKKCAKMDRCPCEPSGLVANVVTAATIQHQRSTDSECGVYSLHYIYKRIHNEPIATWSKVIPDEVMIAFRKKLFKDRKSEADIAAGGNGLVAKPIA
jgi:hypothetical protein